MLNDKEKEDRAHPTYNSSHVKSWDPVYLWTFRFYEFLENIYRKMWRKGIIHRFVENKQKIIHSATTAPSQNEDKKSNQYPVKFYSSQEEEQVGHPFLQPPELPSEHEKCFSSCQLSLLIGKARF
jgi:hypothetical protein